MIFVTGGTGFVGNHIVGALLSLGEGVKCLVRPGSEKRLRHKVEMVKGDIFLPDLAKRIEGCKAIIHLIGIIREFPKKGITFKKLHVDATYAALEAAKKAGIRRFIHMSALGTRENAVSEYHKTKFEAETLVKESGLVYTIFRPSVIYGPYDHFVTMLSKVIKISPILPIIGDGLYKMQPVHVKTVALAFVFALYLSQSENKVFELGGPEALSYNKIVDIIANVFNKKIKKIHVPLNMVNFFTKRLQNFPFYPLTEDMLVMLLEGNVVKDNKFYEVFPLKPIRFSEGLRYLK
ncbi:MAG TPA: NAD-dependent epimerase/dehydratase family protein [Candidatus Desulfofervidus auxilii]|uniref:NAD-dependent epimerase/dehydratase family protein n=1 Tax=Desulfofervidus auxilii TaxID=1621989 RepID=A0A7V0NEG0_DESA2|nr:NAD-dependent epimerase/dehydratase family protein [Candidatus Desulfofervidus auxilii]